MIIKGDLCGDMSSTECPSSVNVVLGKFLKVDVFSPERPLSLMFVDIGKLWKTVLKCMSHVQVNANDNRFILLKRMFAGLAFDRRTERQVRYDEIRRKYGMYLHAKNKNYQFLWILIFCLNSQIFASLEKFREF